MQTVDNGRITMRQPIQTQEQAKELLALPLPELLRSANTIRETYFGNTIELCAIINAKSGNCQMNCAFCSQSKASSTDIAVYPLLSNEILIDRIETLLRYPIARIGLVTSGGKLSDNDVARLVEVFNTFPPTLRKRLCVSLGRLSKENIAKLAACGITRFHHNLESSETFYPTICTSQNWKDRLQTVLQAKEAGFTNCTGGLFGMGERFEDRIDLAFTLKEHHITSIPLNFLYPHPKTPLAEHAPLSAEEALRIIALFRHILPTATLRICGGRPTTLADKQDLMFKAGANALMTGDYLTTQGNGIQQDLSLLKRLGLAPLMPESA